MFDAERFAAKVVRRITVETPSCPEDSCLLRRNPGIPRMLLQAFPGAWEAFLDRHPGNLLQIARQRGAESAFRRRAEELEAGGLWRPEADLDAWVAVVWPTFCIGPDLYRLRYGMLPSELLEEEIEMEERRERAAALDAYIKAMRQGVDPEDGGFLIWFLEEAQEEELRQLLEAERKAQRGLWPEWEDEEALQAWIGRLDPDWSEEYGEQGHMNNLSELEAAQAVARLQSVIRSRTLLNAAQRLGYGKIKTDYGSSGKLVEETR